MKFRSANEAKDYEWRFVLNAIHGQGQMPPKIRCPNGHLNYTRECETCRILELTNHPQRKEAR